tara:strand:- start:1268 stop:1537 length:270 start_codon:yes stop_codon:yes gene_type:complete
MTVKLMLSYITMEGSEWLTEITEVKTMGEAKAVCKDYVLRNSQAAENLTNGWMKAGYDNEDKLLLFPSVECNDFDIELQLNNYLDNISE